MVRKLLGIYYDYYIKNPAWQAPPNNEWMAGTCIWGIIIRDLVLSATKYYFTYQLFPLSPLRVLFSFNCSPAMTIWKIAYRKSWGKPRDFHIITWVLLGSLPESLGNWIFSLYLIYGLCKGNLFSIPDLSQTEIVIIAYRLQQVPINRAHK